MRELTLKNNKVSGFTIIEILLAGFIMFLVLTTMTQVYRGALLSSDKAETTLRISGGVPAIQANISQSIRSNGQVGDHGGDGQFGELRFKWFATLTHSGEPSVILQEDAGREIQFFLWYVELEVTGKGQTRRYNFTEVSW